MTELTTTIDALDRRASARLLAHERPGRSNAGLRALHRLSQTGSYGVGWIGLFAAVVSFTDGLLVALVAGGCVIATLLTNSLVKLVVRRPRPQISAFGHQPTTHSMPSAHTSMAVVGAAIMTLLIPQLAPLWIGWAVVLGMSRIILGMHYVGDVVVGAALGLLLALAFAIPLIRAVS